MEKDEHSENFNKIIEKYKKLPSRILRAEEYKNWTEKYTGHIQQQAGWNIRKQQSTLRQGSRTHPIGAIKIK